MLRFRRPALSTTVAVCILALPTAVAAQLLPAFTETATTGTLGFGVDTTRGWEFTVSEKLQVEQLGFWDSALDGLNVAHPVGIWLDDGTLLTSATVLAGTAAPLDGKFRWVGTAPVILWPGNTYVIGAYWPASTGDLRLQSGQNPIFDPRVSLAGGRLANATGLVFPFFSGPLELNANFKASAVPNQPPVADAGPDQTLFLREAATLDGTATDADGDSIVGWMWAIESSPPGSSASLSRPFSSSTSLSADLPGDYEISLVAYDGTDWSLPDTVVITYVENQPPVAVGVADRTTGTAPLTVQFDGTQSFDPEGEPLLYLWEFGDGNPPVLEPAPAHTFLSPGTFLVLFQVHDDFGQMDSDTIEITVLPRVLTEPGDDSGRYSSAGFHNPSDTDYTAQVGATRSFFVFDLTSLTDPRPVASASLVLDTGTVSSGAFGGITYTLFEVSNPIPTLVAGGSGLTAIYDDLGSGVPYSAATEIEPGTSNTDKSIPLLPAGVAAVEAAQGGMLAIGGGPTGLSGNFAFSGTDVSGARLVIEFEDPALVPVLSPAAVTMLASLLAGAGFATLRGHQRQGVH